MRSSRNGCQASQPEGVLSDGESIVIDGTLFTACPWWDGPIVKAGIGAQLAEASTKRPERWIWLHHAPPAKSPTSWGGDRYFGDVELREWIEQYRPDMVLSGHVHQSPFVKDGSWVDQIGPTWVSPLHLDAALGQNVEPPGRLALGQQHCTGSELLPRNAGAFFQD